MPHCVRLSRDDQIMLLNLLADSFDYKAEHKLRSEEKIAEMSRWYIDAAEKIRDNDIQVNNRRSNFWLWLKDQLAHSGTEIWRRPDCQEAVKLCEAAAEGTYDRYRLRRSAERLFEVNNEKTTSS